MSLFPKKAVSDLQVCVIAEDGREFLVKALLLWIGAVALCYGLPTLLYLVDQWRLP